MRLSTRLLLLCLVWLSVAISLPVRLGEIWRIVGEPSLGVTEYAYWFAFEVFAEAAFALALLSPWAFVCLGFVGWRASRGELLPLIHVDVRFWLSGFGTQALLNGLATLYVSHLQPGPELIRLSLAVSAVAVGQLLWFVPLLSVALLFLPRCVPGLVAAVALGAALAPCALGALFLGL
jgi:hypothetical protein